MRIPGAALGALLVVFASAIFGGVGLVVQATVATGFALPVLLAARYLATAGTVGSLAMAKGEHVGKRPGLPHWSAFGLGLAAIAQTGCYFAAISRIDVALVLALHFTFPALVLVIEAVIARRLPTGRQLTSCLLALSGVALVVLAGGTSGADPVGLALACGSGLVYSAIVVCWSRILRHVPPTTATAFQSGGLGVAWLIAALVTGADVALPGLNGLGWLAFLVLVCSVLPMLLLARGTALVGPVAASTLATAEPVVGAALAAVLLGQAPAPLAVIGASLIVCGSFVVVAPAPTQGLAYALRARRGVVTVVRPVVSPVVRPIVHMHNTYGPPSRRPQSHSVLVAASTRPSAATASSRRRAKGGRRLVGSGPGR